MTYPSVLLLMPLLLLHFMPRLTRPGLFFGVTVDPEFRKTAEARRVVSLYRGILWGSAMLATALMSLTGRQEPIFLVVAGVFCAQASAHRRALPYAIATRGEATVEVDLAAPRESLPGGPLLALLPFALLAAAAVWISRHWSRIPQRIPTHLGTHGADRWVSNAPSQVYGLLASAAGISLFLVLFAVGVMYRSRRASAGGCGTAEERRYRRINTLFLLVAACLPGVEAWILLLQPPWATFWAAAAPVAIVAVQYAVLIPNRLRSVRHCDRTPDSCWKLGSIYFNPSDPALFIPKRFGLGYVLNFGNRWSWVALATVVLAASVRVILRSHA